MSRRKNRIRQHITAISSIKGHKQNRALQGLPHSTRYSLQQITHLKTTDILPLPSFPLPSFG